MRPHPNLLILFVAALLLINCSADPHRRFSGPVVKPLWHASFLKPAPISIHDGILYLCADQPGVDEHAATHLYALDVTTGKQLWVSDFVPDNLDWMVNAPGVLLTLGYPHNSTDPKTRRLYSLDPKTGQRLWMSNFNAAKPVFLLGSQVFATEDGDQDSAHTLDVKNGKELATSVPTHIRRGTVVENVAFTTASDGVISALDTPAHPMWTAHIPHPAFRGPVVAGNNVYYYCVSANEAKGCQTPDGEIIKDAGIQAFDRQTGTLRWTWQVDRYRFTGMTADPKTVFISAYDDTGVALALDARNGRQKWTRKLSWNPQDIYFRRTYPEAILFDPTTVVFFDQPSNEVPAYDRDHLDNKAKGTVVHAFNRATGEPLWQSTMPWKYDDWQVFDGHLYASDGGPHSWETSNYKHAPDSWFTVLDLRTGKQQWRSNVVPLATFSRITMGDGVAVFAIWPYRDNSATSGEIVACRANRTGK
jgi:outer membrane protein assembly factor BamB